MVVLRIFEVLLRNSEEEKVLFEALRPRGADQLREFLSRA